MLLQHNGLRVTISSVEVRASGAMAQLPNYR